MVHAIQGYGVYEARQRFPDAAIIRPVVGGVVIFDNPCDAIGHPTGQPVERVR